MGTYPSVIQIEECVYPPELAFEDGMSDKDFEETCEYLQNTLKNLSDIVTETHNRYGKSKRAWKQEKVFLNTKILLAAKNLLKVGRYETSVAALQMAGFVAMIKGNINECDEIFRHFDGQVQYNLRENSQHLEAVGSRSRVPLAHFIEKYYDVIKSFFCAVAMIPPTNQTAADLYNLCARRLMPLAENNFDGYEKIIQNSANYLDDSCAYGGLVPIVERSLAVEVELSYNRIDGWLKENMPEQAWAEGVRMIGFVSNTAANFYSVPWLHDRLTKQFEEYQELLESINPYKTAEVLTEIRDYYKKTLLTTRSPSFEAGLRKQIEFVDTKVRAYENTFAQPQRLEGGTEVQIAVAGQPSL